MVSLFLAFLMLFSATPSIKSKSQLISDVLFSSAMENFNKKKFSRAADLFKDFVFKFPLSDSVDMAQYYLARSYKEAKQYDDAITEYLFLISTFPFSRFVELSYLEIAECHLSKSKDISRDTEGIENAKKYIVEFKMRFPNSEYYGKAEELEKVIERRKGAKYLYIAETYLKIGEPRAGKVYIDLVKENYSYDDSLSTIVSLLLVESYILENKCDSANYVLEHLKEMGVDKNQIFSKKYNRVKRLLDRKCKK